VADVRLDSDGIAALLKSAPVASAVHDLAETIASNVRSSWPDADVVVDDYETDRRASSVTIREPRAKARQVRDGILTRAAAGAGLEVKERR
jgi:hypothetical protein